MKHSCKMRKLWERIYYLLQNTNLVARKVLAFYICEMELS